MSNFAVSLSLPETSVPKRESLGETCPAAALRYHTPRRRRVHVGRLLGAVAADRISYARTSTCIWHTHAYLMRCRPAVCVCVREGVSVGVRACVR